MTKLSIIIPCHNEEANIKLFYQALKDEVATHNYHCEAIFINDGSKDNTLAHLKELKGTDNLGIKVISFSRNFGKEAGIFAGLNEVSGEYAAIIDADLQQHPELVFSGLKFLNENENYDAVSYCQEERKEGFVLGFFKRTFYKFINKIADVKFVQGASDFRVMRKCVVEAILQVSERNRFSKGIFSWVGFNTKYLPYVASERNGGVSNWSFKQLFNYAVSGIVSYSSAPLRLSTIFGLGLSILSFLYIVIVLIQKIFFEIDVPGYPTLIVVILFIGGIQFLMIGIIGEYLAKTFIETKNRPLYIIKEKIESKAKND